MGHVRPGVLPRSKRWDPVVEALKLGDNVEAIAELSPRAAEASFKRAVHDPTPPATTPGSSPDGSRLFYLPQLP